MTGDTLLARNLCLLYADTQSTGTIHCISRIEAQIHHYLLQMDRVHLHIGQSLLQRSFYLDAAGKRRAQNFHLLLDQRRELQGNRFAFIPTAEREHLSHQTFCSESRPLHPSKILNHSLLAELPGHLHAKRCVPKYNSENVVEIVGNTAGQLAQRLHLARLGKLPVKPGPLLPRLLAFSGIRRLYDKILDSAFLIEDRRRCGVRKANLTVGGFIDILRQNRRFASRSLLQPLPQDRRPLGQILPCRRIPEKLSDIILARVILHSQRQFIYLKDTTIRCENRHKLELLIKDTAKALFALAYDLDSLFPLCDLLTQLIVFSGDYEKNNREQRHAQSRP